MYDDFVIETVFCGLVHKGFSVYRRGVASGNADNYSRRAYCTYGIFFSFAVSATCSKQRSSLISRKKCNKDEVFKQTKEKTKGRSSQQGTVSPFSALCTALSGNNRNREYSRSCICYGNGRRRSGFLDVGGNFCRNDTEVC